MKKILCDMGRFVHSLQKERGLVAVYLSGKNDIFLQKMKSQFNDSDKAFENFKNSYHCWHEENQSSDLYISKLQIIFDEYTKIGPLRQAIQRHELKAINAISHYSYKFISPLLNLIIDIAFYDKNNDPDHIGTYNNFLEWKERIGLERIVGNDKICDKSPLSDMFVENMYFLLTEQKNHHHAYMALANPEQKKILENILTHPPFMELEEIRKMLASPEGRKKVMQTLSLEKWLDLLSKRIDLLHNIEEPLIYTLNSAKGDSNSRASYIKNARQKSPPVPHGANEILEKYGPLLRAMPLFANMNEGTINDILAHGVLQHYKKGKTLFIADEVANNFYIILSGWVKLYKTSSEGDEAILHILHAGNIVLETAVFLNAKFPMNAQILTESVILSLPAAVVRAQIQENPNFTFNLLTSISYRSQSLIHQIENMQLKTAEERVGWFLLKLLLEQGRLSRHIKLPYEKSVIASYLDMKRETFSRALNKLKTKGFIINNDTVTIPDTSALCNYCNREIGINCKNFESEYCPL